jgi:tetratricopeptide (TPR) repeat protein
VRLNGFVNYDDPAYVSGNPHVNGGITLKSIVWVFTNNHVGNWHPLTGLSHILDCELFGLNPLWHHLTSLLFHIVNTLLLFWVLKRMTGGVWASAFVAAAFAIHPLHVESVAWVAERKDVLSGFFWMLTMAAYIRYAERPGIDRYLLVGLVFCLALMAKPMVVTLPFVLLLLDYWPLGRLQWEWRSRGKPSPPSKSVNVGYPRATAWRLVGEKIPLFTLVVISSVVTFIVQKLWRLVGEKIPLFTLVVISSVVTFIVQKSAGAVPGRQVFSPTIRIANSLISYLAYIGKMVWPSRLAIHYPHPSYTLEMWRAAVAALLLLGISIWVIRLARSHKYLLVGWLWYLITLAPVIGLVQVGGQAMADRYTYLPSIGIFIMVAWGAAEVGAKWRYRKIGLGISAGLLLAVLLICTRMQVRYWQNDFTLFGHALEVTENNARMHNYYGVALRENGRFEEAITHFDESLQLNPGYSRARYNKGRVFLEQRKLDEAIASFTEVLRVKPDWPEVHNYLGLAYARKGRFVQAIKHFKTVLQSRPDWYQTYNDLGLAYSLLGKHDLAIQSYREALRLKPDYHAAINNLKIALEEQAKINHQRKKPDEEK